MITTRTNLVVLALLCLPPLTLSSSARAVQSRDHLTPQEVELVKDAQVLDQRIEIFVKAADRRLLVLTGVDAPSPKQLKKDSEKWGELPNGSRAELLGDIAKILDEAITNIDDVSARDEKNPLIPKALRKLEAMATRIFDQLRPLREQAKGDAEIARFEELTEVAESILDAAKKLPPPVESKEKARTKATGKTEQIPFGSVFVFAMTNYKNVAARHIAPLRVETPTCLSSLQR